jgi:hypothetical protein
MDGKSQSVACSQVITIHFQSQDARVQIIIYFPSQDRLLGPFICWKLVFFWKVNSGKSEFQKSEFRESIFRYLVV